MNKGEEKKMKQEEKIGLFRRKGFWFFVILFVVVLAIRFYAVQLFQVQGESMMPTLQESDILLVEKFTYRSNQPERFDIIVLKKDEQQYVKRIIGLPKETIQIKKGQVYVNGKVLKEPIVFDSIEDGGMARDEMVLGEDEYFVLGDNRNNSKDSRHVEVGIVNRQQIQGKIWKSLYPFRNTVD